MKYICKVCKMLEEQTTSTKYWGHQVQINGDKQTYELIRGIGLTLGEQVKSPNREFITTYSARLYSIYAGIVQKMYFPRICHSPATEILFICPRLGIVIVSLLNAVFRLGILLLKCHLLTV